MSERLGRLRELFDEEIPALVVTGIANVRYLLDNSTLFDPHFGGALLVDPDSAWLIVDSRYIGLAESAGLPCRVKPLVNSVWETLAELVKKTGLGGVGFESQHLTVAQWRRLKDRLPVDPVPAEGLVEGLRMIKEEPEIALLAQAARITDQVFEQIKGQIRPGLSERDLALEIDFLLRRAGADDSSFDTIVATGPNSAFPHAGAGPRLSGPGDFVKIDFGAVFQGYHADMTRTMVLGPASARHEEVYHRVLEAQELVLESLAPGVSAKEADTVARDYFTSLGLADNFSHNLGHGVGLDVHERPTLGSKSNDLLTEGMVFTVEPGLYFPGFGGVRIEDMVVVREHGIQVLTRSTKKLIEI
jgi:Xaa-Pro aminopeptidase